MMAIRSTRMRTLVQAALQLAPLLLLPPLSLSLRHSVSMLPRTRRPRVLLQAALLPALYPRFTRRWLTKCRMT